MPNNGQQSIEAIRDDMSQLREDLNGAIKVLMDSGKSKASAVKDKSVEAGRRAIDATETQIKERPFLSIMIVFLVGILLGKMFDQRLRS